MVIFLWGLKKIIIGETITIMKEKTIGDLIISLRELYGMTQYKSEDMMKVHESASPVDNLRLK